MPIRLLRILIRGPKVTPASDTVGGVIYLRETAPINAIYLSLETDKRSERFNWPRPDDSKMKVTTIQFPFSRKVGVEFCSGSAIDTFVDAVAHAGDSGENCAKAVAWLLEYFQKTYRLSS